MVLLAAVVREGLIPGVTAEHFEMALSDLLAGVVLESNLTLFHDQIRSPGPVDRA